MTLGLPEEEGTWVVPVCEDETCEVEACEEPLSALLMDAIKVALSGLLWSLSTSTSQLLDPSGTQPGEGWCPSLLSRILSRGCREWSHSGTSHWGLVGRRTPQVRTEVKLLPPQD